MYHLPKTTLHSGTVSQKMTYLHPFNHTYILCLCTTINKSHTTSLSLSLYHKFNPRWANNTLCCTCWNIYSCNHAYIYILPPGGLTQKPATRITHVLQPRTFIPNEISYTHKISPHHTKKTTFEKSWIDSPTSVTLFQHILTSSDPTL